MGLLVSISGQSAPLHYRLGTADLQAFNPLHRILLAPTSGEASDGWRWKRGRGWEGFLFFREKWVLQELVIVLVVNTNSISRVSASSCCKQQVFSSAWVQRRGGGITSSKQLRVCVPVCVPATWLCEAHPVNRRTKNISASLFPGNLVVVFEGEGFSSQMPHRVQVVQKKEV